MFRFSPWIASRTCVTVRPGGEPRRIQVDPDLRLLAADEPDRVDALDPLEARLGDVVDLLARIWLIARDVSTVIQAIGVSSSELTAWMTGASAPSGVLDRVELSETSSRARSLFVPQLGSRGR